MYLKGYDAWKTATPREWEDDRSNLCDVYGFVQADGRTYQITVCNFAPCWTYSRGNEVDDFGSLDLSISFLGALREPISYQQEWDDGDVSQQLLDAIQNLCLEQFEAEGCITEAEAEYDDRDYDREAA